MEAIVTTRGLCVRTSAARSSAGSSSAVSAKWPSTLVPNCISKPSAVSCRRFGAITPALLISRSSGTPSAISAAANLRIDSSDARSSSATSALAPGASARTRAAIPAVARVLPPDGRPVLRSHPAFRRLESGALSSGAAHPAIGECLPHPPPGPAAGFGRTGCRVERARGLLSRRLEQPLLQRGLRLRRALLFLLSGGCGLLSADSQRRPSTPPARQGCVAGPLVVRAQFQRDGRNAARHAAGLRVGLPPAE